MPYVLTIALGRYVRGLNRRHEPEFTNEAAAARRFDSEDEAEIWGARWLGDIRFRVHPVLPRTDFNAPPRYSFK